jgi:hypothetical protein
MYIYEVVSYKFWVEFEENEKTHAVLNHTNIDWPPIP